MEAVVTLKLSVGELDVVREALATLVHRERTFSTDKTLLPAERQRHREKATVVSGLLAKLTD